MSDLRQGLDLMLVSIQECCMAPLLSSNMGVAFIFIVNDLWMLSCIFFYLCLEFFSCELEITNLYIASPVCCVYCLLDVWETLN